MSALYECGVGYSFINTARSALSSILMLPVNVSFGSHPLVSRLLKGVFELRPSFPKYQDTWDISVVLKLFENWNLDKITLKDLSLKLTMLLAITTSQRIQTLKVLSSNNESLKADQCCFKFDVLLQTSQPRKHLNNVVLASYPKSKNLCPIKHLQAYLEKTSALRGTHTQLLVSYRKPHNPVSTDTLARWIKAVMGKAGINTEIYGAHSTRVASTSAAHRKNIDTDRILAAAGWSNENTFSKFYNEMATDVTSN